MKRKNAINWFGVVFGVLMIVLPFAGSWWMLKVGDNAASVAISPFNFDVKVVGVSVRSVLVDYILLFSKITFMIAGVFSILASLFADRWWSAKLLRFGVMNPFWGILTLIIILIVGTIFANAVLPKIVSGMIREGTEGGLQIKINVPFLSGSSKSTIVTGDATVSTEIRTGFQMAFLLAVITAGVGIASRIYHRRFLEKEEIKKEKVEKKK
ncbi:MAG: hypothetical protein QXW92_01075 [Candidatus Hadarchaeales archaeon]